MEELPSLFSCRISGIGAYVPERVVKNDEFSALVDTSDAWISSRTGIRERHFAADGEYTSDMATVAARRAMVRACMQPEDIELIVVSTISPDNIFPSTAARVQANLGAWNAAGFDLEAACAGFIYGIEVGRNFIQSGTYQNVLVVGSEKLSTMIDMHDRNTCVLFGDGAGAVVLQRATETSGRILATVLGMDAHHADLLQIPAGGCRLRPSHETVDARQHCIFMKGRETFRYAVNYMVDCTKKVLEKARCTIDDLKLAVPHQANLRIIEAAAEKLGLKREQVFLNVDRYGNTSSASVGIALDEAVSSGMLHVGDKVLLVAFGSGFSLGAILLQL